MYFAQLGADDAAIQLGADCKWRQNPASERNGRQVLVKGHDCSRLFTIFSLDEAMSQSANLAV